MTYLQIALLVQQLIEQKRIENGEEEEDEDGEIALVTPRGLASFMAG